MNDFVYVQYFQLGPEMFWVLWTTDKKTAQGAGPYFKKEHAEEKRDQVFAALTQRRT